MLAYPRVSVGATSDRVDELNRQFSEEARRTSDERKQREKQTREKLASYGTYAALISPAFVVVALALFEGVNYISELASEDFNSEIHKDRVRTAIYQFSKIGIIPPAFQPVVQNAASYADLLESILKSIYSADEKVFGSTLKILEVGKLIKSLSANSLVATISNNISKGFGMGWGGDLFPDTPGFLIGSIVALNNSVRLEPVQSAALDGWNSTGRFAYGNDTNVLALANAYNAAVKVANTLPKVSSPLPPKDIGIDKSKFMPGQPSPIAKVALGGSIALALYYLFL